MLSLCSGLGDLRSLGAYQSEVDLCPVSSTWQSRKRSLVSTKVSVSIGSCIPGQGAGWMGRSSESHAQGNPGQES